ncbi:MAG: hypothetical protein JSU91_03340 [Thermoplasmatales archaeon]|nr:MAG: hypothetical protein JSU91_03340 [Thermoplasmatales archaeon]
MNKYEILSIFFALLLVLGIFSAFNVKACKDIIACGDATAGNYNLLLKVRDPSRPGIQVLCIIPKGYEYTYRHPWTGKPFQSEVLHKFIGVATKGDTIPNIVKAGMTLTDAGLAFGDADTKSRWTNPTKNAWDDFDWIRYACEKADNEDQAISLLTKDVVSKMHATGVSENLFIVGPKKAVVIEADAFHYKIDEFENGVVAMSNYPKVLWKTQRINTFLISRNFDTEKEKNVRNKGVVRLNSLYGIRVIDIGSDYISAKPISYIHALRSNNFGVITKINISERKTVGFFSVELLDINANMAKVRVVNKYKAWEEKILEFIEPKYGSISVKDMINWSRLHSEDLDGLRPMCQDIFEYESVTVYKVPEKNYDMISSGWFSASHPCLSIYVPFHICNTDIYDTYETGDAAELSLNLRNEYGHGTLENGFSNVEEVFLNEIDFAEQIALQRIDDTDLISNFLTIIDTSMQRQGFLTQEIWLDISKITNQEDKRELIDIIDGIWYINYSTSLEKMKNSINGIGKFSNNIAKKICELGLDICKSRIDAAISLGNICPSANEDYKKASQFIENEEYDIGFDLINKAYNNCNMLIQGKTFPNEKSMGISENSNQVLYSSIFLLILGLLILSFVGLKQKR